MYSTVFAQTPQNISGEEPASFQDLEIIFSNVLTFAIPILAIVLFVMLMLGGLKFITSGGNQEKTASAKSTITWAIGGLVLAALAYLIISVIAAFTGQTNIQNFVIYQNTP